MKLDIEYVRDILIYLEQTLDYKKDTYEHDTITIEQVVKFLNVNKKLDKKLVAYVIEKLCEANIIKADISYGSHHSIIYCNIYDISYQGHQLLANIRPESIWERTKGIINVIGNHSLKFIEDTAQRCAVTATATLINSTINPL